MKFGFGGKRANKHSCFLAAAKHIKHSRAAGDVKLEKSCGWSSSPGDITKRSQNCSDTQTIQLEDKNVNMLSPLGRLLQRETLS